MSKNLRWGIDLDTAEGIRDAEAFFNALKSGGSEAGDFLEKRFSGSSKYVIELQTVVNKDTGLKELVPEFRKINEEVDKYGRELNKLNSIQEGSLTRLRQQRNEAAQARDSYAKFRQEILSTGQAQTKLNQQWVEANQKVKQLETSLAKAGASNFWQQIKSDFNLGPLLSAAQGIGTLVNAFQAIAIVIQQITGSVGALFERLTKLQSFGLVFESIGQGVAGASAALAEADRIALGAGANIDTVRESFQKVAPAILATGGSITDVSETVQALTTRFVSLGKSQDEQRRAFNAVVQVFGKGKLQAEELTQQLGEVDSALKTDLAAAAKVSVAAFEEMVKDGKITSEVFADLIKKIDKTDQVFNKLGPSATSAIQALGQGRVVLQQVLTQFSNLQTLNLQSLAKQLEPFLGGLLAIRASFIDLTTQIVNSEAFKTLITVFNSTSGAISTIVIAIINLTGVLIKALEPFAALLNQMLKIPGVAQIIGAAIAGKLIGSLLSLTNIMSQNARDFGGFRGLLVGIADIMRGVGSSFDQTGQKGGLLKSAMEMVSKSMNKTTESGLTFKQALMGAAPAAVQTAAGITQVATAAGNAQGKTNLFAAMLNLLGMGLGTAGDKGKGAQAGLDAVGDAAKASTAKGGQFLQMALNLGPSLQSVGTAAGSTSGQAQQLGLNLASVGYKAADATGKAKGFQLFLQGAGRLIGGVTGLVNPLTIGLSVLAGSFAGMVENNKVANATTAESTTIIGGLEKAMKDLGASTEQVDQKMNPLSATFAWLGIGLEALIEGAKSLGQGLLDLGGAIGTAVAAPFQLFGEKVREVWRSLSEGTVIGKAAADIFGQIGAAVNNVGKFFDGTIIKQYQLNKATEATANASLAFGGALDKTIEAYVKESAASDGSVESKKKLQAAAQQMVGAVQAEEARLKALADQYGLTGKDVSEMTEEERLLYQTIQSGNIAVAAAKQQLEQMGIATDGAASASDRLRTKLEEQAAALEKVNEAKAVEVKDNAEERIKNLEKEKEAIRSVSEQRVAGLEAAKVAATAAHESIIANLESEKQKVADTTEQRLAQIERVRAAETARHDAEMKNLDLEAQKIQKNADIALEGINKKIEAENRRYSSQIANIESPSAAEGRLKELEIEKLKVTAMKGATEEERLRAQVALERIAKEDQRAQAERAHQQNMAELEEKKAAIEKKKEEDLEALENKRRTEEKKHEDTMMALEKASQAVTQEGKNKEKELDKQIADAKKAQKESEKSYDKQIADEKKKTSDAEKKIEEDIKGIREQAEKTVKALKQEVKDAQVNINKAVDDQIKREEYVKTLLNQQLQLKREIAAVKTTANTTTAPNGEARLTSLPPPRPGYAGPGYFAGGYIPGGVKATVNELGKEAFLGRSGRLSMINAPSFGQWRAPESGIVIPAHITAGLNVPQGGINVGRGIATARRSAGGDFGSALARMLTSALGAPQGRVTNNVTIQSQQPVNDASRLLVEMSRLKVRGR